MKKIEILLFIVFFAIFSLFFFDITPLAPYEHFFTIVLGGLFLGVFIFKRYFSLVPLFIGIYLIYSHYFLKKSLFGDDTLLVGIPFVLFSFYIFFRANKKELFIDDVSEKITKKEIKENLERLISICKKIITKEKKSLSQYYEALDDYVDEIYSLENFPKEYSIQTEEILALNELIKHMKKTSSEISKYDDQKLFELDERIEKNESSIDEMCNNLYYKTLIESASRSFKLTQKTLKKLDSNYGKL